MNSNKIRNCTSKSISFILCLCTSESLGVLFYVCSQQGDIRTAPPPPPPKKNTKKKKEEEKKNKLHVTLCLLQVSWQCLDSFASYCFSCCSWWRGLRVSRWLPRSSGFSPAWSCCWKRPRLVLGIVTFRVWIASTGGINPFHENYLCLCNSWID